MASRRLLIPPTLGDGGGGGSGEANCGGGCDGRSDNLLAVDNVDLVRRPQESWFASQKRVKKPRLLDANSWDANSWDARDARVVFLAFFGNKNRGYVLAAYHTRETCTCWSVVRWTV